MPGMINQQQPAAPGTNELKQLADQIEQKIPAEMRATYDAIVTAGSHLLWSDGTFPLVKRLVDSNISKAADIPQAVASGIVKLISTVITYSKKPPETLAPASMPASQLLMLHVLEFVQKKMNIPITHEIIAKTSYETTKMMFKLYGVTKEKFKGIMEQLKSHAKNQQDHQDVQNMADDNSMPFDINQQMPQEGTPPEGVPPVEAPPPGAPPAGVPPMPQPDQGAVPPGPDEQAIAGA